MVRKFFLGWWIFFLIGCGFVVEDPSSESIDYVSLMTNVQSLTVAKGSSYTLSLPDTNEWYPQVYRTPWNKTYLFYIRGNFSGPCTLYAAEMDDEGNFKKPSVITNNLLSSIFAIFDGRKGNERVPIIYLRSYSPAFYELTPDFGLAQIFGFSFDLSPLMVWNGSAWETWAVYNSGESWRRVEVFSTTGGWDFQETSIILGYDIVQFFSTPMGGVGVIGNGESNFALLMVKEKDQTGPPFVFQQVVITIKGNTTNLSSNWILSSTLVGVNSPFVDAQGGYQIYFSWQEEGKNFTFPVGDLYRFRYLTWDKLMPRDIRSKLP
ncbi:hypothetical protein [Thermospira aquatica]|uniref:Lipoprotein n=1 Tax=Thermospira aquatica TaxID=2828656 RepID=A0AAX3BGG6_9SPIR|nr:hypothetical protein [Thermospira aquatica]URA11245.1 hypothetical protein KDW03_05465 [Thermospira aquatica]